MRSKSWRSLLVVSLTIFGSARVASAAVKLPALFTDNMVLQHAQAYDPGLGLGR